MYEHLFDVTGACDRCGHSSWRHDENGVCKEEGCKCKEGLPEDDFHSDKEEQVTSNSSIDKKYRKERFAGCSCCPWHGGENRGRQPKHVNWKKERRTKYK